MTGLDSSATHSFSQIKRAVAECGARLVLINLTPELDRAFRVARFISGDITVALDLDRALESCEETVLEAHGTERSEAQSLRAWLSEALGSPEYADRMVEHCRRLEVQRGDVIARQGDDADSIHFILEGRVGVVVDVGGGSTIRVRALGGTLRSPKWACSPGDRAVLRFKPRLLASSTCCQRMPTTR